MKFEAEAVMMLGDFFNAFALLLLRTYVRHSTELSNGTKEQKVRGYVLFAILAEYVLFALSFIYVGSPLVEKLLLALNAVPQSMKDSPLNLLVYLVRNLRVAYDIFFALAMLCGSTSMVVQVFFSKLVEKIGLNASPKSGKEEQKLSKEEIKKQKDIEEKKEKALQGPSFLTDMTLSLLVMGGIYVTLQPSQDLFRDPKFKNLLVMLPPRSGIISMIGSVLLMREHKVWNNVNDEGKKRVNSAGYALLFRFLGLNCLIMAWFLDSANGDMFNYFDQATSSNQAYMIVALLYAAAFSIGFLGSFFVSQPLVASVLFAVFPVLTGLVSNPNWVQYDSGKLAENLSLLVIVTTGTSIMLGGMSSISVSMLTCSVILSLHQTVIEKVFA